MWVVSEEECVGDLGGGEVAVGSIVVWRTVAWIAITALSQL